MNQNMDSKAFSAPNLSPMDFPALSTADSQNGMPKFGADDVQQNINPYRTSEKDNLLLFRSGSSFPTRGAADFASAVRKMAPQDSAIWKYDRNGSADANVGSSRSSHVLASSYNSGQVRGIYGDILQSRGSARGAPVWLETGEAVGNILKATHLTSFMKLLILGPKFFAPIYSLILLAWQQICILRSGRKLVIMLVYAMHSLNR